MRILFFSELVSLAHLARPLDLIAGLPPGRHEIHLASDDRYRDFLPGGVAWHKIRSITPAEFESSLHSGNPPYDAPTLEAYREDDERVIREVRPDLVVGDFRLSLSVSARLAGVPLSTLSNLHWCPTRTITPYPLPSTRKNPLFRNLPLAVARMLFRAARPRFFGKFLAPLNRFRSGHGQPPFASLEEAYTAGDHTLYVDFPGWMEISRLPDNAHELGPTLWSPPVALPSWWGEIPSGRPCIFINVGSSGDALAFSKLLQGLETVDADLLVATAGKVRLDGRFLRKGVWVADFLPGEEASRRARLVICNGGSPSVQQALACGKPVLGMPGNLDQFLNMEGVLRSGAGLQIRSDRFSPGMVKDTVNRLLSETSFQSNAERFAALATSWSARSHFLKLLDKGTLLAQRSHP